MLSLCRFIFLNKSLKYPCLVAKYFIFIFIPTASLIRSQINQKQNSLELKINATMNHSCAKFSDQHHSSAYLFFLQKSENHIKYET